VEPDLMARKNILASITDEKLTTVNSAEASPAPPRAPSTAFHSRGAFGAVTRTIDDLAAKAEAAREIEAKLTAGESVIDLDPDKIDASFAADRLSQDDEEFQNLVEAIRERGQDSPILVRPNPQARGRYQVAFGHRRLRVAKVLGRQVRAVVKALTDRDLVLAQGQENSARANLSFIERALFARRLEDGGYDRETIMSALSVDKTVVSKMVSVASRIPVQVIEAIGSAASTGRDRWVELSSAFHNKAKAGRLDALITSRSFIEAASDQRFNKVLAHFGLPESPSKSRGTKDGSPARFWATANGTRVARVTATDKAFVLAIDKRVAPDFGDYLLARMERLFEDYANGKREMERPEKS
jgi:ParB family transcriptional regulator, chromosome partitioning protein